MSHGGRLDRLERALGGEPERQFCGPWGHRCADAEAPHDEFTLRVDLARDDDDRDGWPDRDRR
jgi:hypothetical protein